MNREQQIVEEIKRRLTHAESELRGYSVYLFGSRADGTAKIRSDFDVGVLGSKSLPLKAFYKVAELLDDIDTLYSIDWVNLNNTSDTFRDEALKKAKVLYG